MRKQVLSPEQVREMFDYNPNTGMVFKNNGEGRVSGSIENGIIFSSVQGKGKVYWADIAWTLMKGQWPSDYIFYENLDGTDCRWENLYMGTEFRRGPISMVSQVEHIYDYDPKSGKIFWKNPLTPDYIGKSAEEWRRFNPNVLVRDNGEVVHPVQDIVWAWITGRWPRGEVRHLNGEKTDNRWRNLTVTEEVKKEQINLNGKGDYPGLRWDKTRNVYEAWIYTNETKFKVGEAESYAEALKTRVRGEINHFGYILGT